MNVTTTIWAKEARRARNSVLFYFCKVLQGTKINYIVGGQDSGNPWGWEAVKGRGGEGSSGGLISSISSSIGCLHSLVSLCKDSSTYTLGIYVLFCL